MTKSLAPNTKKAIVEIMAGLSPERRTPETVKSIVKSRHRGLLDLERGEIEDIALAQIIDRACKRRGRSDRDDPTQIGFWQAFELPQAIAVPRSDGRGNTRLSPYALTRGQIKRYIADHQRVRAEQSRTIAELRRLLDETAPFAGSDDELVAVGWEEKLRSSG